MTSIVEHQAIILHRQRDKTTGFRDISKSASWNLTFLRKIKDVWMEDKKGRSKNCIRIEINKETVISSNAISDVA